MKIAFVNGRVGIVIRYWEEPNPIVDGGCRIEIREVHQVEGNRHRAGNAGFTVSPVSPGGLWRADLFVVLTSQGEPCFHFHPEFEHDDFRGLEGCNELLVETRPDVIQAIQQQSQQVTAGQVGAPPAQAGQAFQYTLNIAGRLDDKAQFEDIIVKTGSSGDVTRVRDVGWVELGAQTYSQIFTQDGQPAAALGIFQTPGANALQVEKAVEKKMAELAKAFPQDVRYDTPFDTTKFVQESINEVYKTLFEAGILVLIVILIFLQDWRAMLVPATTVPVTIIGAFAAMAALGFTINLSTLFAIVLAIGIVVDDAIVVVEGAAHNIEQGMSGHDASIKAMDALFGPIIGITLVLISVFLPAAFLALRWGSAALAHVSAMGVLYCFGWFGARMEAEAGVFLFLAILLGAFAAGARWLFARQRPYASVFYGWFAWGALLFFAIAGYLPWFGEEAGGIVHRLVWLIASGALIALGRFDRHMLVTAIGVLSLIGAACALLTDLGLDLMASAAIFLVGAIIALVAGFILKRSKADA